MLEKELEVLERWFAFAYPYGKIKTHTEKSKNAEVIRIAFSVHGKNFGSELTFPLGIEYQDSEYITGFKKRFLETQKEKITKAARQILVARG